MISGSGTCQRSRRNVVVLCVRLDLLAVGAVVLAQLSAVFEGGAEAADWGRAPVRAALTLGAFVALLGAGAIAGTDLIRHPLQSATGRVASLLAVVNALFLPSVWAVSHLVRVFGIEFHVGWGMPYFPVWVASGFGAVATALVDRGERPRAALVFAALLGVATLTFFLGDMVPN